MGSFIGQNKSCAWIRTKDHGLIRGVYRLRHTRTTVFPMCHPSRLRILLKVSSRISWRRECGNLSSYYRTAQNETLPNDGNSNKTAIAGPCPLPFADSLCYSPRPSINCNPRARSHLSFIFFTSQAWPGFCGRSSGSLRGGAQKNARFSYRLLRDKNYAYGKCVVKFARQGVVERTALHEVCQWRWSSVKRKLSGVWGDGGS